MNNLKSKNFSFQFVNHALLNTPRSQKKIFLILMDATTIVIAFLTTIYLLYDRFDHEIFFPLVGLLCISVVAGIVFFTILGTYSALNRDFDLHSLIIILVGSLGTGMIINIVNYLDKNITLPRSIGPLCAFLIFLLIVNSRVLIRRYYVFFRNQMSDRKSVVIYGAGEAGSHVASVLKDSGDFNLVAFIDDNLSLKGSVLKGRKIYGPNDINSLKKKHDIFHVLLCISTITNEQMLKIISRFESHNIKLEIVPSFREIIAGRKGMIPMRTIAVSDILAREQVEPITELFDGAIKNKTILITGAGGSIGSEICRQILLNEPKKLILIDHSEPAAYALEQSLYKNFSSCKDKIELCFELCSVCDRERIRHLMNLYKPDVVYHAAAYKHVPMVESNRLAGIKNNTIGTLILAEEALAADVDRFILVSTDKAVRPTNTMGASKRVAELIIQAMASDEKQCKYSIVRFGNVIGSSGSVVPLFTRQIEEGGPVTVTHKKVNRFFMTISEAAQLVIQAGFLAKGGEVFILDMGKPHRIDDLARTMIKISGHTVKSQKNPSGDIEIVYTGLRPGEKLYEEVLLDSMAMETPHPKILTANEPMIKASKMRKHLATIQNAIDENDTDAAINVLLNIVVGYTK